ncbi:MAG: hypothetical protein HKO63_06755 [Acidimicrobiia bacterium]|nr:hypothetical protein [Acidimicrobiia bacterium]NNL97887.1 hypothetical protein [Acidimicrobiia bacterium]
MTVDLDRQLRDYASHVTEVSPAVEIEALLTETADALPPLALRSRPRRAAALVAAAFIVVVIGGLALGYRFLVSDIEPVVTQPSSTLPTPTTAPPAPETTLPGASTTVPAPTTTLAAVPPMTWKPAPPQAALGAGDDQRAYMMHTVISSEGRLIAAGSIYSTDESSDGGTAAIWMSENGVDWELMPIEGSDLDVDAAIYDLAVGDFGYLAVGEVFDGLVGRPAVWISSDLVSWTQVQSEAFQELGAMQDVAAGERGIVTVGSGSVWLSEDGWTWQHVLDSPSRFFADVVATNRGFAAAGWREESVTGDAGPYLDITPHLFVSEDGWEWENIELPQDASWFGAQAQSIVIEGDDILVAGNYRSRRYTYFDMHPAFWASDDRVNWDVRHLAPTNVPELRDESADLIELVATGRGPVAVGRWLQYGVGPPGPQFQPGKAIPAVWGAPGNQNWAEVIPRVFGIETFDGGRTTAGFDGAVAIDGKVVAVATQEGRATVWIGEWTD